MSMSNLLDRAHDAASAAILAHFQAGKREKPFNCGFAWVTIPGTSSLARWAKAHKIGGRGYPTGWMFWCPGEWPSARELGFPVYAQDMDFMIAGAKAFAAVLQEHGYHAVVDYRLD